GRPGRQAGPVRRPPRPAHAEGEPQGGKVRYRQAPERQGVEGGLFRTRQGEGPSQPVQRIGQGLPEGGGQLVGPLSPLGQPPPPRREVPTARRDNSPGKSSRWFSHSASRTMSTRRSGLPGLLPTLSEGICTAPSARATRRASCADAFLKHCIEQRLE